MINELSPLWNIKEVRQMILCAIVLHKMSVEDWLEFDAYLTNSNTFNTPQM